MNRRHFLSLASAAALLPLARYGYAARIAPGDTKDARLVVVFLRGAVDGLSVVAPYTEQLYYQTRPNIALPPPGRDGALADLDGRFGLHPALGALLPYWREGSAAFVHAAGSPDPTRSHFDAQDYMESGTPGVKSTTDGWMNRLLPALAGARGMSFGPLLPRILAGSAPATNVPVGRAAARPMAVDMPQVGSAFDRLYRGDDALSRAYREGQQTRKQVLADLKADMEQSAQGAPSAMGFPAIGAQAGRLLAKDPAARVAFLAVGGWDTHVNQGGAEGQLANRLRALGEGLAALIQGLGRTYERTVIVVLSEFGRTVRENGNGGTDHGHGNVIWLLGGPVQGGKVYGDWRGLDEANLYEGRDLVVTTDFRAVLRDVLTRHLAVDKTQIKAVFPNSAATSAGYLRA